MDRKKILIIDDSVHIIKSLSELLKKDYDIIFATNGIDGIKIAKKQIPDLILLDIMMTPTDGYEVCRTLKFDLKTKDIPIIFVTAISEAMDEAKAFQVGGSDYVTKPFVPIVVEARIKNHLQLSEYMLELKRMYQLALDSNPITGLPGNNSIHKKIDELLKTDANNTIFYIDLDNFKSYNDVYGFAKGDEIIQLTNTLLEATGQDVEIDNGFYGHIGGDDFIAIVPTNKAKLFAIKYIEYFDRKILEYYNEDHVKSKKITTKNRLGETVSFPIVSVSIAGVNLAEKKYSTYIQVNDALADVKKMAKAVKGSSYFLDRRKND